MLWQNNQSRILGEKNRSIFSCLIRTKLFWQAALPVPELTSAESQEKTAAPPPLPPHTWWVFYIFILTRFHFFIWLLLPKLHSLVSRLLLFWICEVISILKWGSVVRQCEPTIRCSSISLPATDSKDPPSLSALLSRRQQDWVGLGLPVRHTQNRNKS